MPGEIWWYPTLVAHEILAQQGDSIFYLKVLCVCAVILDAASHFQPSQYLTFFTDNINTVQLFNLLSALPIFNWMVIQVADCVLNQGFDFRVFHIPDVCNEIADALSHLQNDQLTSFHPELVILPFHPP